MRSPAMIDNQRRQRKASLSTRTASPGTRVLDVNDRALRNIVIGFAARDRRV